MKIILDGTRDKGPRCISFTYISLVGSVRNFIALSFSDSSVQDGVDGPLEGRQLRLLVALHRPLGDVAVLSKVNKSLFGSFTDYRREFLWGVEVGCLFLE